MGFSRQVYWSGLPFPSPGIFPTKGSNPCLLNWQVDSLPLSHLGNLEEMLAEFKPKSTVFRVYVCPIFPSALVPFFRYFFHSPFFICKELYKYGNIVRTYY